jgi:putative transposase
MSDFCSPQDLQVATNAEHTLVRQVPPETTAIDPFKMTQKEIESSLARSSVVAEYRKYAASAGRGEVLGAKKRFIKDFNQGEFGPWPNLFKITGKLTFQTLERWQSKHKIAKDPLALADNRGKHRKGQSSVSPEQARILTAIALSPNKPKLSEVVRMARKRMHFENIEAPHSDKTYLNFLNEFKKSHLDTWTLFRHGEKALNEKCLPHIERDLGRIEVGDILVADGHVLDFEILYPFTGKPKRMMLVLWYDFCSNMPLGWEISPTENTQGIATAMRRAILYLGKIPKIAYLDNGRAFRSRFFTEAKDFRQEAFTGLFERLGIKPVFAWPYHGESKPVERFFQTFSELERRAFSFVGTSIADKPPRLMRGERVHRALHDHYTQGKIPTIEEAHHAIAAWIQEYAVRPQRGHLNGRKPLDVFMEGRGHGFSAEQEATLRILMSAHEVRQIKRDGITLPGSDIKYYHPALYGRQIQSAQVRFDWQDKSQIFVYTLDGDFICVAERREKTHPAAVHLGTEADKQELQSQIALRRGLEKHTLEPARALFKSTICPEVQFQQDQLGLKGQAPLSADPRKQLSPLASMAAESQELSQSEDADVDAVLQELEEAHAKREISPWEKARTLSDFDRYEALQEIEAGDLSLPPSEKAWMSLFERTDLYKRHEVHFEQNRMKVAYMHGA